MTVMQSKIYVAGHRGMVGSAIFRALKNQGQTNVVVRTHAELDLIDQIRSQCRLAQWLPYSDRTYLEISP